MLLCSDLTPGLVVKLVLQLYTYIIGVYFIFIRLKQTLWHHYFCQNGFELVYDGGRT